MREDRDVDPQVVPSPPAPSPAGEGSGFTAAYAAWQELAARHGPAQAYKPALKLPDLARGESEEAREKAAWAVGRMLFLLGRFGDALRWLPACPEQAWARALLGETTEELDDARLHFYRDEPEACLTHIHDADEYAALLRNWAARRLGRAGDEAAAHQALARCRRMGAAEAESLAIYAMAACQPHPAHALVHLDHALALGARYGIHHLDARLNRLKAEALNAAGQLGAAGRIARVEAAAQRRAQ